jgi:hypothetical protein
VEEPLLVRSEATSLLFAILEINQNVERILRIVEEEVDGEDPEADT